MKKWIPVLLALCMVIVLLPALVGGARATNRFYTLPVYPQIPEDPDDPSLKNYTVTLGAGDGTGTDITIDSSFSENMAEGMDSAKPGQF